MFRFGPDPGCERRPLTSLFSERPPRGEPPLAFCRLGLQRLGQNPKDGTPRRGVPPRAPSRSGSSLEAPQPARPSRRTGNERAPEKREKTSVPCIRGRHLRVAEHLLAARDPVVDVVYAPFHLDPTTPRHTTTLRQLHHFVMPGTEAGGILIIAVPSSTYHTLSDDTVQPSILPFVPFESPDRQTA